MKTLSEWLYAAHARRTMTAAEGRIRLDLKSRPALDGLRDVTLGSDGSIEVRLSRLWWLTVLLFTILVGLVVVLCVSSGQSLAVTVTAVVAVTIAFPVLQRLDGDEHWTRTWCFASGGATRQMRLPLPRRAWPRDFTDVLEFEIVHTLWTEGFFGPSRMSDVHQDTLRFWAHGIARPLTIMTRVKRDSAARLRGDEFTQDRAGEVEREIILGVLALGAAAAEIMGVPLYVREKTTWVGPGTDG